VRVAPQPGTEENLSDFLCESKDHLTNAEEALLALDQDRGNVELINTVFRAFHTIKGVSGFMALTPIVSLAHSAEQLLDGARSGAIALTRGDLDQILAACDMMSKLMGVLQGGAGPTQAELKALVARLDAAASGTSMNEPPAAAPTAAIIAAPVAAPKQVAASTPAVHIAAPSPGIAQAAPPVAAEAAPQSQPAPAAETDHKTKKSDQTVKVSTTRMDSLVTMVGELVIAQQMVVQDVAALGGNAQRVQRTLAHMSKMVRELQEVSMSLRMVNLKSTFQKMTRLVRDVSQKAGKQIDVVTEGEEVELDRNVVEAITDPLVHMIRNACDHGVEGPEERRSVGKSPNGRLSMRAYHAGGSIVIEIGDDGRGLRREKLLAKAHAKGLLPADNNDAAMPDSEVFALIFLPGFSTAEKVTDISGRGVGMDVVRRNIEALRGKVDIRSTPGQGTTFVLRLPLTMAIIDGMVVRVGSQRYVLPTLSIEQSFRPKADDIKTVVGAGEMVMVRGSMLPVYRLNRVLGRADGGDRIEDGLLIVMETHDARFCLMVDVIVGQQSVVIKTLTQTGQHVRGVSGGAILGDGRVALILDVSQVVALALEGGGQAQSSESATISTRSVRTGAVVGAE
jgi:two-component system chemotaxis sensor kinase CheA